MAGYLSVSPALDLDTALKQIEKYRQAQVQGLGEFQNTQNQNLGDIYGKLQGGIQQGTGAIQGIFNQGAQNVGDAYSQAGMNALTGGARAQGDISDVTRMLGLDPRAAQEVSSRLGQQSATFDARNRQSMANRMGTMQEQGSGMAAMNQLAVQAAQQSEAQSKKDLSSRIMNELQRANTGAMTSRSEFTGIKAQQMAAEAARADTERKSALKELIEAQKKAAEGNDPLDQMIKMLKIQQMQGGLDPESIDNQMKGIGFATARQKYDEMNAEDEGSIWDELTNIRGGGGRSRSLLQKALDEGTSYSDSGSAVGYDPGVSREWMLAHMGNLNPEFEMAMLNRLEKARTRKK